MRAELSTEMRNKLINAAAEQQLLGAMLTDDRTVDKLGAVLSPELFGDPVHGRICEQIMQRHRRGEFVSPVTLRLWAEADPGVTELGGPAYLVRLAGAAVATFAVRDYAALLDGLRAKRALAAAAEQALEALADDETDAATVSARLEAALGLAGSEASASKPVSAMAATTTALQRVSDAQAGNLPRGVKVRVPELGAIVPVLRPGQLILLGGRPSMGKSAVALEIARHAAEQVAGSGAVCFASLEMPADDMMLRIVSSGTGERGNGVPYSMMEQGDLTQRQMGDVVASAREASILPIEFLPATYRDVGALYAGAKQVAAKHGAVSLVVVDYLQLLRSQARSRYEQITEISIALKALALQLDCPVLALTQLSRQCEARDDKRPQMQDLRDSGQLEQDADTVIFCYREDYYLAREEPRLDGTREASEAHAAWMAGMDAQRNRLELIVAKQRQGQIGTAHLRFNPALNLFWGA